MEKQKVPSPVLSRFVDGSIVAIAERLKINQILTFDNKHFSSIVPVGFDHFGIL